MSTFWGLLMPESLVSGTAVQFLAQRPFIAVAYQKYNLSYIPEIAAFHVQDDHERGT